MVKDEIPFELEILVAGEAITPRRAIDHVRIFEPVEITLLPGKLERDVRNGELRNTRGDEELDFEASTGSPVERSAFDDRARLAHPQGVGRNVTHFAIIFRDVDGTSGAPDSPRIGQLIKLFIFHVYMNSRFPRGTFVAPLYPRRGRLII